jgi:AcrR family transcriptional regulator
MMAVKKKTGRPAKVPGEKSTREKIFDAALDLFAERGYDGVSTRDIAAAVGIKDSSIYKHYASKDEILEKIVDYPMARIGIIGPPGVETEELIVTMGLEGFMAMAAGVLTSWMEDPYMAKIFRVICVEAYHNEQVKKSYLKVVTAACSFWETNFAIMRKHKLIKPYDPKMLSLEFLSFFLNAYLDYFLFCYSNTSNSFPQGYKDNIDRHVAFMVNSIKP